MKKINILLEAKNVDFEKAKQAALAIAEQENEYALVISWWDRKTGKYSPQCLKWDRKDIPGWELYGLNHEGRLRISINNDRFVFICSWYLKRSYVI